ncbi:helix-turn-helix domain-containing protein [Dactylosporangium sp. NBC_01737]|uniref:helix-turn-helix domain-containing protein n=1 Tax=Dactylosporangium sp. NBC_01737 TaxID=2975959 RepID=UPI002E111F4E|nr:helix-turn-helix domain-containing protein [Dactylosporangium sp. NBC_01737]
MYSPKLPEAMEQLSMSRSVIYEQIRAGRLRTVTQGRTRLVPGTAIADYVALGARPWRGLPISPAPVRA